MTHFDTINTPSTKRFEKGRQQGFYTDKLIIGNHEFTREVKRGSSNHYSSSRRSSVSSEDDVSTVSKSGYDMPGVSEANFPRIRDDRPAGHPPPLWNNIYEPMNRAVRHQLALDNHGLAIRINAPCALL